MPALAHIATLVGHLHTPALDEAKAKFRAAYAMSAGSHRNEAKTRPGVTATTCNIDDAIRLSQSAPAF
jgi:hypothetical protein